MSANDDKLPDNASASPADSVQKSAGNPASASWLKSNLATLGSAAVVAVYTAGYARTSAAAAQFDEAVNVRRAQPVRALSVTTPPAAVAAPQGRATSPAAPTANPAPVKSSAVAPSTKGEAPTHSAPAAQVVAPASTEKSVVPAQPAATPSVAAAPAATVSSAITKPAPTVTPSNAPVVAAAPVTASTSTATAPAPAPTAPAPSTPTPAPTSATATAVSNAATDSAKAADKWKPPYKNGVFTGYGTSRHGDVEVKVEVQDGWIISATISRCLTEYSCSWIAALPPEVPVRQSPEVDYVTGATHSSNAFYSALVQALSKAK